MPDEKKIPNTLELTKKEELAVIVERLKSHCEACADEKAKIRLELAADLVRMAIYRR